MLSLLCYLGIYLVNLCIYSFHVCRRVSYTIIEGFFQGEHAGQLFVQLFQFEVLETNCSKWPFLFLTETTDGYFDPDILCQVIALMEKDGRQRG